jgi:hypothetical protein
MTKDFAPLPLAGWQATRDTIAGYAKLLRSIRRADTPHQKHWWHVSLRATATGLTTTPIPAEDQTIYEMQMDLTRHLLLITTNDGRSAAIPLHGQSLKTFRDETMAALAALGITPRFDQGPFEEDRPGTYDRTAVATFWLTLSRIDAILKEFRHGLRGESSSVQFWPHHFDLALLWFSGRKIHGQDPASAEWSDEQMNFGFSTGDGSINEPYFYATAYPIPSGWTGTALPGVAYWQEEGWTGAVLPYQCLVSAADGRQLLLDFLTTVQEAGEELMREGEHAPAAS